MLYWCFVCRQVATAGGARAAVSEHRNPVLAVSIPLNLRLEPRPVSDFVSRWFARGAGAQMPGNDVPGVYPLFELEPNSDRDVMFSDGHASRIQHLGGHGNDGPPARAFHIRGFLREEEAAELIAEAQARPGGPQLSGTERGKAGAELWRNSEQVWVPRGEHRETSALVRSINQRTAELTRMPLSVVADGSIQIARYVSGSILRVAAVASCDTAVCARADAVLLGTGAWWALLPTLRLESTVSAWGTASTPWRAKPWSRLWISLRGTIRHLAYLPEYPSGGWQHDLSTRRSQPDAHG